MHCPLSLSSALLINLGTIKFFSEKNSGPLSEKQECYPLSNAPLTHPPQLCYLFEMVILNVAPSLRSVIIQSTGCFSADSSFCSTKNSFQHQHITFTGLLHHQWRIRDVSLSFPETDKYIHISKFSTALLITSHLIDSSRMLAYVNSDKY